MRLTALLCSAFVTGTLATTAATVDFANNTGSPKHLASGTLYGLPDDENQIPVNSLCGYGTLFAKSKVGSLLHGYRLAI